MRIPAWGTLSVIALALCGCSTPISAPTASGTGDGGTTVRSGGLSLITEPGPGDRPFIALINSAQHSIQVTMYKLTDQRVEQALAAAAARGVRVEVLLDHGQYGAGRPLNDAACRYLATHGVTVAWAPTYFALTHQKSIVI